MELIKNQTPTHEGPKALTLFVVQKQSVHTLNEVELSLSMCMVNVFREKS